MHRTGKRFAFLTSLIAVGVLLYSPLCSLSCSASDCYSLSKTKATDDTKKSGHCHHNEESNQEPAKSQSHSSIPRVPGDSRDCPGHADPTAVPSSAVRAPAALQQSAPHVTAPLIDAMRLPFGARDVDAADRQPFRLPPKRAVISVYRI